VIRPLIEFCASNLANGAHKAFEELKKDYDLDVYEYGCLSHCGKCDAGLYALVEGEVVKGETPEDLVEKIYQYIEENELF